MTARKTNRRVNLWDFGLNPGRIEALCDGVFAIARGHHRLRPPVGSQVTDSDGS
jgi:hypothetical protein